VFALDGDAMDTSKVDEAEGLGVVTALAAKPLPDDSRFSVERSLTALSTSDFFIDLKKAPTELAQPGFSRLETTGRMHTVLSRDFDGAVFLHQVHGAALDFLPRPLNLAISLVGWVFQHMILATLMALLCVAGLIRSFVWLRRRQLKKKSGK
jgi:hypothetical protein